MHSFKLGFALLFMITYLCWSGCTDRQDQKHLFTVNSWAGYTPLIYIHEKGLLKNLPFEFVFVASLGESLKHYRDGLSAGFAGTQYEALHSQDETLKPVILLDRSYGGDKVLSNLTQERLKQTDQPIAVYLENDSINTLVFEDFVKNHGLGGKRFRVHNIVPSSLSVLPMETTPMLVVTYEPYATVMKKRGLLELVSTRDLSLFVLDALFVNAKVYKKHQKALKELKGLCEQALTQFERHPQEYFETVKKYMEGQSFKEFTQSLEEIQWLIVKVPEPVKRSIREHGISMDEVIE